jgi:hypothetical protein
MNSAPSAPGWCSRDHADENSAEEDDKAAGAKERGIDAVST